MNYIAQLAQTLPQPLDAEEQKRLLNVYYETKNEDVRQTLLEHNLRLCLKTALDVCIMYDLQDHVDQAFSICYEELSGVLDRYDINQPTSFAAFAVPNMKYKLMSYLEDEKYRLYPIVDSEVLIRENERHNEDSVSLFDNIQDDYESSLQEQIAGDAFREDIIKFINSLNWRERRQKIVKLYLGLDCSRPYTKSEIASIMNISRQQSAQVITDSLPIIQEFVAKNYPDMLPLSSARKKQDSYEFKNSEERNQYIFESYYGLNGRELKNAEQLSEEVQLSNSFIKDIAYSRKEAYEKQHNTKISHSRASTENYYSVNLDAILNDYFGLNGSSVHSKDEIIAKYKLAMSSTSFHALIFKLIEKAISEKKFTSEEIELIRQARVSSLKSLAQDKCKYCYCSYYGLDGYEPKRKFQLAQEFGVALSTIENWIGKYKKLLSENDYSEELSELS